MGKSHAWWWDSHVNPKNSKWLEESLEAMDGKVKEMLKLIEEDADSFAQRAEMYYKKRPELVSLVEEFYRSYRSLAERYDQLTGELRKNMPELDSPYGKRLTFKSRSRSRSSQDRDNDDGEHSKSKKPKKKKQDSDSSSSSSSSSEDSDDNKKPLLDNELEQKLSKLQDEVDRLEKENASLLGNGSKFEADMASMEKDRACLRDEVASTKQSLQNALAEVQNRQQECQRLKQETVNLSTDNKGLIDDLRKEHEKINLVLKEMGMDEGAAIQDMFKELQQDCSRLQQEKEASDLSISKLESRVLELTESEGRLLREHETLLKDQVDLQEKHKVEVDEHTGLREVHVNLLGEHKEKVSLHEAEMQTLKDQVSAGAKQISQLEEHISSLQGEKTELENRILSQEEDSRQLKKKLHKLLEMSGFEQAQSLGDGDVWVQLEGAISGLQETGKASEARACSVEAELQKLEADIRSAQERINVLTGEHQSKVDEVAELDKKMRDLEVELASLREAHRQVQGTLGELQATMLVNEDSISCLQQEKQELEGKLVSMSEEVTESQLANKNLQEEAAQQATQVGTLHEELLKAREEHSILSTEHHRGLEEAVILTASLASLRDDHSHLQEQHKGLKEEHMTIAELKCKLEAEGAEKEKQIADHVARASLLEGKLVSMSEEVTELQLANKKLQEEAAQQATQVGTLHEELLKSREEHSTLREEHSILSTEHHRGLDESVLLTASLASLRDDYSHLQEQHKGLKEEHMAIAELKCKLEAEGAEKEKQIADHVARACSLDEQVSMLQKEKVSTEENLEAEKQRSNQLQVEITKVKEQLFDAQQRHSTLENSHQELSGILATLTGKYSGLEADHGRLNEEHLQLRNEKALMAETLDIQLQRSNELDVEIARLKEEIAKTQEQHTSLTARHEEVAGDHQRLQVLHKTLQDEHATITERKCVLEAEGTEKSKHIAEYVKHITQLQSDMEAQLQRSNGLDEEITRLKDELAKTQEQHFSLTSSHQEVSTSLKNLQDEHKTITERKCILEAEGAEKEKQITELVNRASSLQEQITQLQNNMATQVELSNRLNVEIVELKEELAKAQEQHSSLTTRHQDVSATLETLTEDHLRLQVVHKSLEDDHSIIVAEGAEKDKQLAKQESHACSLEEQLSQLRGEKAVVVEKLEAELRKVHELEVETLQVKEELYKSQEQHASLTSDHQRGMDESMVLAATLTTLKEEHHRLQENHNVLEDEKLAISELKSRLEADIDNLRAEKEQQTSEHREAFQKLEEEKSRELSTAVDQHKLIETELLSLKAEHENLVRNHEEIVQKMEVDITRLQEALEEETKTTRDVHARSLDEKTVLEKLITDLQDQVSAFKFDLEASQSTISASNERIQELEKKCKLGEDNIAEALNSVQVKDKQVQETAAELQLCTQRVLTLEQDLVHSRDEGEKLKESLDSMTEQSQNMDSELKELRETLASSQQDLIGIKQVAETEKCSRSELEIVVAKLEKEIVALSALEVIVANLQAEKSTLTSEAETMKEQLSIFEEQAADLKARLESQVVQVKKLEQELLEGQNAMEDFHQRGLEEKALLESCTKELREQIQQLQQENGSFSEQVQVLRGEVEKLQRHVDDMKVESDESSLSWQHEKELLQAELKKVADDYAAELEMMRQENDRTLASLEERTQLHQTREVELESVKKSRVAEIMGLFKVLAFGEDEEHVAVPDSHEALEKKALELQSKYLELKQQSTIQQNDIVSKSDRLRDLEDELDKLKQEKADIYEEYQRTLKQEEEEHSEYEQQIENLTSKCRELEASRHEEMHKLYAIASLAKASTENGTGDITFDFVERRIIELQETCTKAKEQGVYLNQEVESKSKRVEELEEASERLKQDNEAAHKDYQQKSAEYEQHSGSLRTKLQEVETLRAEELRKLYHALSGNEETREITSHDLQQEICSLQTRLSKLRDQEVVLQEEISAKSARLQELDELLKEETVKTAEHEQQVGNLNVELRKIEGIRTEEMIRLLTICTETQETRDVTCDLVELAILDMKKQKIGLQEQYNKCLEKSAEYEEQIKHLTSRSKELENIQAERLSKLYSVLGVVEVADVTRSLPLETDDDVLEQKISELKEQKLTLNNEVLSKSTRIQELEDVIAKLRQDKCALEEECRQQSEANATKAAGYLEQISKLDLKIQEIEQENEKLRDELSGLQHEKEAEVHKLEAEKSEFRIKIIEFEETLEGLHTENKTLGENLTAETQKHNEGIHLLQDKLSRLEEENKMLLEDSAKVKEAQEELHSAHEDNRMLRFELSKRDVLVKRLEGDFNNLQADRDEVGDKLEAEIVRMKQMQGELLELREEDRRLKNKVDALASKVQVLQEKINTLERENKALLDKAEGDERENKSLVILARFLRAEVMNMVQKVKSLRNDILESDLVLKDKDADLLLLLEDVKNAQVEKQRILEENVVLARKVDELQVENRLQHVHMAEEKREAIRQLCFSLNWIKDNNQRLKMRPTNTRPESSPHGTWKKYLNPWYRSSPPTR